MSRITPKKRLSSVFIFLSVFFGSIMGAGITMLSSPKTGKDLKSKIKGTTDILKENVNKKIDTTRGRLFGNSTNIGDKARTTFEEIHNVVDSVKERIKNSLFKR